MARRLNDGNLDQLDINTASESGTEAGHRHAATSAASFIINRMMYRSYIFSSALAAEKNKRCVMAQRRAC